MPFTIQKIFFRFRTIFPKMSDPTNNRTLRFIQTRVAKREKQPHFRPPKTCRKFQKFEKTQNFMKIWQFFHLFRRQCLNGKKCKKAAPQITGRYEPKNSGNLGFRTPPKTRIFSKSETSDFQKITDFRVHFSSNFTSCRK